MTQATEAEVTAERESFFDGTLLARRLERFLERMNTALIVAAPALKDFDVQGIVVSLTVDAGLNIGFAGTGASLGRERTLEFTLKPKP